VGWKNQRKRQKSAQEKPNNPIKKFYFSKRLIKRASFKFVAAFFVSFLVSHFSFKKRKKGKVVFLFFLVLDFVFLVFLSFFHEMFFGVCFSFDFEAKNKQKTPNKQRRKKRGFAFWCFCLEMVKHTHTNKHTERKKNKKRGRVQSRKTKQEEEKEKFLFSFFLAERCIENKIPFSKNGG
jgi:hypothetical protein